MSHFYVEHATKAPHPDGWRAFVDKLRFTWSQSTLSRRLDLIRKDLEGADVLSLGTLGALCDVEFDLLVLVE